jgi:anion-transporting  ArsA/GET3 family ATPase
VGKPSGGYSHGAGRFLHGNYDPGVAKGEEKRKRRSPASPRQPAATPTIPSGDGALKRPATPAARALLDRLSGKRVCICLGAGGVGKTTTSAALAVGLAARGAKVAVVTIDPAARLAGALGLGELSGEPTPIDSSLFTAQGVEMNGELWAMMLDAKRTFDDIITRLAPEERARQEILANPIYRELSSAVAGSQELSAIAKLYELRHERDFDVIVLDTPPSRNAIDFLEAPTRLLGFLEGRALKVFIAPGGLAARVFGRSTGLVFAIFARATGVDMLADLSRFFRSLSGVIDGFGERTRGVVSLLRDPSTTFLIVTSPEPEPAREAVFLARRLAARNMSRGGLVVNRVHFDGLHGHSVEDVRALLAPELGDRLAARVAGNLADFDVLVTRDRDTIARLSRELDEPDPILVPHLDEDVQDLASLARLAEHLFS